MVAAVVEGCVVVGRIDDVDVDEADASDDANDDVAEGYASEKTAVVAAGGMAAEGAVTCVSDEDAASADAACAMAAVD